MTRKFKALIVDDEQLAREELKELLNDFENVDVEGEADSVDAAIVEIKKINPDLIFLDIQMPVKNGFDLLNEMETDAEIVFVTAYDEYAIRAFEINALDYLMKPIYPERLKQTINRLVNSSPVTGKEEKLNNSDYIFFKHNRKTRFIKVSSIVSITSSKEYTKVTTSDGFKGLIYKPMIEWENRLPEKYFTRIHRGSIINLEMVENMESAEDNSYKVKLKYINEPLIISRRYAAKLKKIFQ